MRKLLISVLVGAAVTTLLTPALGAAVTESSTVTQPPSVKSDGPRHFKVAARLVDDGNTKITVIRDADSGRLLMKTATDPDVVIDTSNLLDEDQMARRDSDDESDPGVGVSLVSSISSAPAAKNAAERLSEADIDFRKAAIGLAGTGPTQAKAKIFDAGCIKVTAGGEAFWKGCYERRRVPDDDANHWYTLENSWAHGHHDGLIGGIDWASVANRYYKSSESVVIIKQRPVTDLDVDDKCENVTLSLAPEGVGVTDSVRVCPNKIKLSGDDDSVKATWDGWVKKDDDWVASAAMTYAQMKAGSNSVYTLTIKVDEDESRLTRSAPR